MGSTIYRMKTYWASHRDRVNAGNSPRLFQKTILRFVTAHFALLGTILLAAAINPWQENFFHSKGTPGDWQDGFPIAPVWTCVFDLWASSLCGIHDGILVHIHHMLLTVS